MKNTRLILGIIVALFIIGFTIFNINKSNKEDKKLFYKMRKEYPTLLFKDSINCKVLSIYKYLGNYTNNPFSVNIMTNKENMTIYSYKCINNSEKKLQDVININTRIQKKSGTDTLIVINNKKKYKFIIKESF